MSDLEQRAEPRVPHNIRFFVHVQECEEDPDLVGVSIECEAVDFSVSGLQFQTTTRLPRETLLSVTIGIGQPFAMYLMKGQIRWVRDQGGEECAMGVQLLPDEATDYDKWVTEFENIFAAANES